MSESPASYCQDMFYSFTGNPSLIWMQRCALYDVSAVGHTRFRYTPVIHPLIYNKKKQSTEKKQNIFINMKLNDMLQNHQYVTRVVKKENQNLFVEIDATAWPMWRWSNDTKSKNIILPMRCGQNSVEMDIYNIRCKQSKSLLWMIH